MFWLKIVSLFYGGRNLVFVCNRRTIGNCWRVKGIWNEDSAEWNRGCR